MSGLQGGDPAKLAKALVQLASQPEPRCAGLPAPTPSPPLKRRPVSCLPKPTPTASCPRLLGVRRGEVNAVRIGHTTILAQAKLRRARRALQLMRGR